MKISGYSDLSSITLRAGRDIASLLKGVSAGDMVSARIVTREGNIALLDIAGRRLRAEFTGGIPAESTVNLVLAEKGKDFAVFRPAERLIDSGLEHFIRQNFFSFDPSHERGVLSELMRLLGRSGIDLMDINLFLSGIKKDKPKEDRLSDLINRLIGINFPKEALADLVLMASLKLSPGMLSLLAYVMERAGMKPGILHGDDGSEALNGFVEGLLPGDEFFNDILEMLISPDSGNEGYGGFPIPDGEGFSKFRYVTRGNELFMNFSLSALGSMNVFIKSVNRCFTVSIGCDREESVEALEKSSGELRRVMSENGIHETVIGFFSSKKMIDKLRELCVAFHEKSGLDLKI